MNTAVTKPEDSPMEVWRKSLAEKIAKEAGSFLPDDVFADMIKQTLEGLVSEGMFAGSYNREKGWIRKLLADQVRLQVENNVTKMLSEDNFAQDMMAEFIKENLPQILGDAIIGCLSNRVQYQIENAFMNRGM